MADLQSKSKQSVEKTHFAHLTIKRNTEKQSALAKAPQPNGERASCQFTYCTHNKESSSILFHGSKTDFGARETYI